MSKATFCMQGKSVLHMHIISRHQYDISVIEALQLIVQVMIPDIR